MIKSNWAEWVPPGAGEEQIAGIKQEFYLGREAVPLFPVGGHFTPRSPCPHKRDIEYGSVFVCMICHQGGADHILSALRKLTPHPKPDLREQPEPSDAETEAAVADKSLILTRKQRRSLERRKATHVGTTASPTASP